MWDMFSNSLKLFLKGKLFREPMAVLRQWAIGVVATLVIFLLVAKLAPLWLAVVLASVAGGAMQPWLFKDLKYA